VQFLGFLAIVYLLWRFVARGDAARKWVLLGASYVFYATWDLRFLLFLLSITVFQWLIGARIAGEPDLRRKKAWLAASLVLALGILTYCKYVGFFVDELSALLSAIGLGDLGPIGRTIVPIGISFYTFQSLTYTIDLYRGQARPTRSLRDFALFIAFFGHVTAGPISRARLLIPQLECGPAVAPSLDARAVFLIARGLVKKLAIADVLAAEFVSPAFSTPGEWSSAFLVTAVVAYSFQIYMDVSGYTDLARGAGRCFGYDLAINFDRPYLARTVSNFWQRWHISMSSFFRDYLYFGLGGSRRGNVYLNLMLTFVAIGLWHGAGWNFIVYGALHGSMVCFERWRRYRSPPVGSSVREGQGAAIWGIATTFLFVATSRILFVETDLSGAAEFVRAVVTSAESAVAASTRGYLTLAVAIGLHAMPTRVQRRAAGWFFACSPVVQAAGLVVLTLALVALAVEPRAFVYFRF
jgi:D-alanyl-lipoteichoic acid acyltransferase DltB (MBOAT superfamily)